MPILDTFYAKGATSQAAYRSKDEAAFWVRARRNRLLAGWVCDLTDEDSQNYHRLLLDADFARVSTSATEGFLMLKIRNDLMGFGIFLSPIQLQDVCRGFEQQALLDLGSV
ncbi:hypothetical protein CCC_01956 [Paramagnetospirillum magnetotacticum MS-1]|uniref:Uncharacterized protein n=1 Tax=Paramagnetospirillum magnetotacticum MS-1 TaxID=272627 RepID=A0A0C2V085_PARME|nr:ATPase inhibitor subunit zeta [Paramagnetospirillum magnetotacticum]KIL98506.1 hypothetical protein CCC_01956 [Paramagnetospirillum magnetotacticum MS-1]